MRATAKALGFACSAGLGARQSAFAQGIDGADAPQQQSYPRGLRACVRSLVAEPFNSNFPAAHDTYNGMAAASDGCVYYVLCSEQPDVAGQLFRLRDDQVEHVIDLNDACGLKYAAWDRGATAAATVSPASAGRPCAISQGKSHVPFFEDIASKTLHFATRACGGPLRRPASL